jgi:hypothetical protein
MSNQTANPIVAVTPTAAPAVPVARKHQPLFPVTRSWKIASVVGAVMVVLALLGVGLSSASKSVAPVYWVCLVPIYGLLCLGIAWTRARQDERPVGPEVIRQVLHWLGIGVALALDFLVRGTQVETGKAAGFNALLLLALGCYLAGIHLEWVFTLVGVLLSLALIIVTQAEEYIWLIFVVGGLAVAAMLAVQWFLGKARSHPSVAGGAPPPHPTGQ